MKKKMIGVLVIRVYLCSHPINILGAMFLDEDGKKRILIFHLLQ